MRKNTILGKKTFIFFIGLFIICIRPAFIYAQSITGDVWFVPSETITLPNTQFTTEIHVNSREQKFAAYGVDIIFDENIIAVDTSQGDMSGVSAGPDGFVAAVNSAVPGILVITGFDAQGRGPGTDLNVLTIHWLTLSGTGATTLDLVISVLTDETTANLGDPPRDLDGDVTVFDAEVGDANKSGEIDIIDALLISQYFVGLDPRNFYPDVADFNHDGSINIIDALLVAQYYVGYLSVAPTPTPSPTPTDTLGPGITDPSTISENWTDVKNFIQINADQTEKLNENGFVVLSNIESNTISQVYVALSEAGNVPPFITTDALLHVFHITYAHMSEFIEKNELAGRMATLLGHLHTDIMAEYNSISEELSFVKNAARELWIYAAVADALINGKTSISGTEVLPVESEVNEILLNIYTCPTPGPNAEEDYTQYEPRGHYKGETGEDTVLENYFRATTWLKRQRFYIEEETECTSSAILGYIFSQNQEIVDLWDIIYNFLSDLINPAPSRNPRDIDLAMSTLFRSSYESEKYLLLEDSDNRKDLIDHLIPESDPDALYTLFMNTGFSMDIDTMKRTVGSENVTGRFMPNSLDVASTVFNSTAAYEEHQSEMEDYDDEKSLQKVIDDLKLFYLQKPESEWTQSVYNYMLYSLRSLSEYPPGVIPGFMENTSWEREKLNTQLAAWTELHNDNIVYPEASPTLTPSPEPSPEPTPEPTPESTIIPTPPPGMPVIAQYKCGEPKSETNQIKPHLKIVNTGGQSILLSELTLRYYYSKESTATEVFNVDYAAIGASHITGEFYNGYVEIGFTPDSGNLPANSDTGEIQININKTDWSNYIQTNDYSFNPAITEYTDWVYVTLYYNGVFVWGMEPSVPTPTPTPVSTDQPVETNAPTPTPTPIKQGFVEPYPEFYSRLKLMCFQAREAILNAGFISIHVDKFNDIYSWANNFESYSKTILGDTTAFTEAEQTNIKNWGYDVDYFFSEFIPESLAKSHIISDIFTYEDKVLHEAMGKLYPIIVFFEEPGEDTVFAAVGYTMSYYEFEETVYNRIDDLEWETILNTTPPDRPLWTDVYIEN